MPEFQKVQVPVFSPTHCATCLNHLDPDGFVDLIAEVYGEHLYMCASCVYTAANLLGCYSPKQAAKLRTDLGMTRDAVRRLQDELDTERDNKVVSLADVRQLVTASAPLDAA